MFFLWIILHSMVHGHELQLSNFILTCRKRLCYLLATEHLKNKRYASPTLCEDDCELTLCIHHNISASVILPLRNYFFMALLDGWDKLDCRGLTVWRLQSRLCRRLYEAACQPNICSKFKYSFPYSAWLLKELIPTVLILMLLLHKLQHSSKSAFPLPNQFLYGDASCSQSDYNLHIYLKEFVLEILNTLKQISEWKQKSPEWKSTWYQYFPTIIVS